MEISVTVNGTAHTHDVEPRTLLVQYIRENGRPDRHEHRVRHVVVRRLHVALRRRVGEELHVLAVQADGADITTIEGLADADGTLHPMQQAFMENHGLQCGYCTPGMVMAAIGLLDENPHPTEREVRIGLEGNLCRCTGYHNIVAAVLAAAEGANA